jgi:hypothetical protein
MLRSVQLVRDRRGNGMFEGLLILRDVLVIGVIIVIG